MHGSLKVEGCHLGPSDKEYPTEKENICSMWAILEKEEDI